MYKINRENRDYRESELGEKYKIVVRYGGNIIDPLCFHRDPILRIAAASSWQPMTNTPSTCCERGLAINRTASSRTKDALFLSHKPLRLQATGEDILSKKDRV